MAEFKLWAKLFIKGKMEALTGIRVGGSQEALDIGGVDLPVVKTPNGIPYIPGSSIKGKMRSLLEKEQFDLSELKSYREKEGELQKAKKEKNEDLKKKLSDELKELKEELKEKNWRDVGGSFIHSCEKPDCNICTIFGRPAESSASEPTRLYAKDAHLDKDDFEQKFPELAEDKLYTEVKWENVIDRLTSLANPRQVERVPAGAQFDFELTYNLYDKKDEERFHGFVLPALELLEGDCLGGMGSRGYGRVKFSQIEVKMKRVEDYQQGSEGEVIYGPGELSQLRQKLLVKWNLA
jgi:CRISPR-associated protein Csm3